VKCMFVELASVFPYKIHIIELARLPLIDSKPVSLEGLMGGDC
jgi:hypothetical protein